MHTQGMGADLCFQLSPNKRNWKKMFMQTQSVGVDQHSKISLNKDCDWKKTVTGKRQLFIPRVWV